MSEVSFSFSSQEREAAERLRDQLRERLRVGCYVLDPDCASAAILAYAADVRRQERERLSPITGEPASLIQRLETMADKLEKMYTAAYWPEGSALLREALAVLRSTQQAQAPLDQTAHAFRLADAWRDGTLDAGHAQPMSDERRDIKKYSASEIAKYEQGFAFIHHSDVAMEMSRRIDALAEKLRAAELRLSEQAQARPEIETLREILVATGQSNALENVIRIAKAALSAASPRDRGEPPTCSGCSQPMQRVEWRCGQCGTFRERSEQAAAPQWQPFHDLVQRWREHAARVRPLESAPLTAEKRERIAEWMLYSNRAAELNALLPPPPARAEKP